MALAIHTQSSTRVVAAARRRRGHLSRLCASSRKDAVAESRGGDDRRNPGGQNLMFLRQTNARPLEIKRVAIPPPITDAAGVIEGYASLFGVRDTGGDIVMTGAFASSLRRRSAGGVKMLWQHRADEPIGSWVKINEDARGLKVIGRLDLKVARARETLSLLRVGAVDGLSIGFRTVRAHNEKGLGRRLMELDLWEISIVTFPMLTEARVTGVKRRPPPAATVVQGEFAQKLSRAAAQGKARVFVEKLAACDAILRHSSMFIHSHGRLEK